MNKKYQRYINYIINNIELPYLKCLEQYGLSDNEMEYVLSKVYEQPVSIKDNYVYDTNDNLIYYEYSNGYWVKYGYDTNGNNIYYESSDGYWEKKEYDNQGNRIYYENSNGTIRDNR